MPYDTYATAVNKRTLLVVDPMPPSRLSWLHLCSYVLTWSSCFINPFIYCWSNKVIEYAELGDSFVARCRLKCLYV